VEKFQYSSLSIFNPAHANCFNPKDYKEFISFLIFSYLFTLFRPWKNDDTTLPSILLAWTLAQRGHRRRGARSPQTLGRRVREQRPAEEAWASGGRLAEKRRTVSLVCDSPRKNATREASYDYDGLRLV
jgi:hypothetical protein